MPSRIQKIVLTDMPIPPRGAYRAPRGETERGSKYPFKELEPGRGFIIKCAPAEKRLYARRLTSAIQAYRRNHNAQFAIRVLPEGVGCWAVSDEPQQYIHGEEYLAEELFN